MNQSIWCIQHSQWHGIVDREVEVIRYRADHLHIVEVFVTCAQEEVLECVVCGEHWGAA